MSQRIPVSSRIASLGGYAFAEVDRLVDGLKADGVHVLDFGVGDPRAPTPEFVRRTAQGAVDAHATSGYPSYVGSPTFRGACAKYLQRRFGVAVDPDTQVASTIGSKEAVFHAPFAFADPGDVVVAPDPGYPPFTRGALFAGADTFRYPVHAGNGFLPDLGAIPEDVLTRTRMIWVNYPNSPTGAVAPLSFFEEAAAFCRERGILLCSDEAYCDIWYGDTPPPSALQTGLDNVLAFFSLSKRSAMTGWRVGFVAGDAQAVAQFRKLKTNIDSGVPDFVQDAAAAALADDDHVAAMRADYAHKRELICAAFEELGLPDCRPASTIFVWQRAPEGMTSVDFAKRLLDPDVAIVVTPGTWISSGDGADDPGEGFVRLALVPRVEECEEAARRLGRLAL
jgi:LL-diaminopimelate aminotransferase